MADRADKAIVLKTRKVFHNKLLGRRQMVLEVHHGTVSSVSRKELRDKVAQLYKVKDPSLVVVFGLKIRFGGGVTDGFVYIYDTLDQLKLIEPGFRKKKNGFEWAHSHAGTTRKQRKDKRRKLKTVVGTAKRAAKKAASKKE